MTQCNIVKIQFELLPTFHLDARRDIFAPSYVTLVLAINFSEYLFEFEHYGHNIPF